MQAQRQQAPCGSFARCGLGHPNGVALGGLGTGHVELGRTGQITLAAITNNWQRFLAGMRGTFFALRAEEKATGDSRFVLLQDTGQGGAPGVTRVLYDGRHPVATVRYVKQGLPLAITLTAFSPLIPHDVARSAVPAAAFEFSLANRGAEAMDVSLSFSWEHVLGCGGAGAKGEELYCNRTGNTIHPWVGSRGVGLRFRSVLPASPGPDRNRRGECVLAVRRDQAVRPFAVQNWDVLHDEADVLRLLAAGRLEPRFGGFYFDALSAGPAGGADGEEFDPYPQARKRGKEGACHPAGVVGAAVALAPGQRRSVLFVLAWHTPHHYTQRQGDRDWGHFYAVRFPDAEAAAEHLLDRAGEELAATREPARFLDDSDLPGWLADKLLNDSTPLTTNSVVTADGSLATLEGTQSMWGSAGTIDQRLISHAGTSLFYPDLNRTELRTFANLQDDDGSISHFIGNVHQALRDLSVDYAVTRWPDLACSFIIQCYADYAQTGEREFFDEMLPHVRRAFDWLRAADRDGDGIPEGGSSWDIEHYEEECFAVTATLWLATLRVLADVAELDGDADLRRAVGETFPKAAAATEALWNGRYYNKCLNLKTRQASADVHCGQLEGEWVARQLALPNVLPPENVLRSLRTLYELNGDTARHVLMPIQVAPDGRLCARKGSHHAWPQYSMVFVDCLALLCGQVEPAMASIRHFDQVVRTLTRTPWGTTLWHDARTGLPALDHEWGFDHYMNGPAIWWVLAALNGFMPHEVRRRLTLGPVLPPGRSRARWPAISPRYWAAVDVEAAQAGRVIRFAPRRFFRGDHVQVRELRLRGRYSSVSACLGARELSGGRQAAGIYTDYVLDAPVHLAADDELTVRVE